MKLLREEVLLPTSYIYCKVYHAPDAFILAICYILTCPIILKQHPRLVTHETVSLFEFVFKLGLFVVAVRPLD